MLNNWQDVLALQKLNVAKIAYHLVASGKHHNLIRHSRLLYLYTAVIYTAVIFSYTLAVHNLPENKGIR